MGLKKVREEQAIYTLGALVKHCARRRAGHVPHRIVILGELEGVPGAYSHVGHIRNLTVIHVILFHTCREKQTFQLGWAPCTQS